MGNKMSEMYIEMNKPKDKFGIQLDIKGLVHLNQEKWRNGYFLYFYFRVLGILMIIGNAIGEWLNIVGIFKLF